MAVWRKLLAVVAVVVVAFLAVAVFGRYNAGECARLAGAEEYEAAFAYCGRAVAVGDAGAQVNLGLMYRFGRGVARDDGEAVRLYRLAAVQGDAGAQVNLGFMYANGRGVARDDGEAVRLYRLVAAQGDASARNALERLGR